MCFEKWAASKNYNLARFDNGIYSDKITLAAFEAWSHDMKDEDGKHHMKYKIDKNILPPCRFPFQEMQSGDSFFVTTRTEREMARQYARRKKIEVITRKEGDGYRVWMIGREE